MALISFDDTDAAAFAATRELPHSGLHRWRHAVQQHLRPRAGTAVLDLGAGTGAWAAAFTDWYGVRVVGIEPAEAMRARAAHRPLLAGDAAALPLRQSTMDAAWLSTMIHHIPDLDAAARELRRVLRPGAPVLVRSPFPGRHRRIALFHWFPEAVRVLERYPDVARVRSAFAAAGFTVSTIEPVAQTTARSLAEYAERLDRRAHTPLQLITDAEYAAGIARLRAAARDDSGPVVDHLDLLVLR
ncbi:methyltransferase domain-containing protein [Micromonospora sp. WMMD812]|uniref:class I SAM-dependent methyltransferase n=1 Tax=Micromonospora sp. WMMD812 TaxID=3015152 RepID=UPI00248AAB7A|nr:methyltransferase domain-containing protein [Micromonospora sp. WMMD812]WBB70905.1 methyltransferase domain-containing protein [Micromonospora sp. WMMD812]